MIEVRTGDILTADAEALVNPVNCVGVMGRGLALQFKTAFPDNFEAYAAACARGEVATGRMFTWARNGPGNPRYVINFPTKRHWRAKSRMADIEAGLVALRREIERLGIASIAIPPLGAGLGGLDWSEVRSRIVAMFAALADVRVDLFEQRDLG
jgi:O-acetyl-ADP-ribose deacetylase (regulator of RNase III)